jgi:hypothetical protein
MEIKGRDHKFCHRWVKGHEVEIQTVADKFWNDVTVERNNPFNSSDVGTISEDCARLPKWSSEELTLAVVGYNLPSSFSQSH